MLALRTLLSSRNSSTAPIPWLVSGCGHCESSGRLIGATVVVAVAAFAATVSYFDIYERGPAQGQLPKRADRRTVNPLGSAAAMVK